MVLISFKDDQVTVDQDYITVTHNGLNWTFRHPEVRHIRGSFSINNERGVVFFYSLTEMSRASDGKLHDHKQVPVKFVFTSFTAWSDFYQDLKAHGYTSPPKMR